MKFFQINYLFKPENLYKCEKINNFEIYVDFIKSLVILTTVNR